MQSFNLSVTSFHKMKAKPAQRKKNCSGNCDEKFKALTERVRQLTEDVELLKLMREFVLNHFGNMGISFTQFCQTKLIPPNGIDSEDEGDEEENARGDDGDMEFDRELSSAASSDDQDDEGGRKATADDADIDDGEEEEEANSENAFVDVGVDVVDVKDVPVSQQTAGNSRRSLSARLSARQSPQKKSHAKKSPQKKSLTKQSPMKKINTTKEENESLPPVQKTIKKKKGTRTTPKRKSLTLLKKEVNKQENTCNICDRSLSSRFNLERHIKSVHKALSVPVQL